MVLPDSSGFSFEPMHKKVVFNEDQEKAVKNIKQSLNKDNV